MAKLLITIINDITRAQILLLPSLVPAHSLTPSLSCDQEKEYVRSIRLEDMGFNTLATSPTLKKLDLLGILYFWSDHFLMRDNKKLP